AAMDDPPTWALACQEAVGVWVHPRCGARPRLAAVRSPGAARGWASAAPTRFSEPRLNKGAAATGLHPRGVGPSPPRAALLVAAPAAPRITGGIARGVSGAAPGT